VADDAEVHVTEIDRDLFGVARNVDNNRRYRSMTSVAMAINTRDARAPVSTRDPFRARCHAQFDGPEIGSA